MHTHGTLRTAGGRFVLGMAVTLLALDAARVAAQSDAASTSETYIWSAELVSFDEATRTVTVAAPIVSYDRDHLAAFEAGDRVDIQWSGSDGYASGIRRVVEPGELAGERFVLPAEFVGITREGRYVSFTLTVPADAISGLAALEPGDWVTVTAVQMPADPAVAVASIRAYTDIG